MLELKQVMGTSSWLIRLESSNSLEGRKSGNPKRNGGPKETTLWNKPASSESSPGAGSQGKSHVGGDMGRDKKQPQRWVQAGWVQETETHSF